MAIGKPDISYAPDFEKYQARTKRRLESENLSAVTLPEGFPRKLESEFVWEGKELEGRYEWIYELSEVQVEEVERGLEYFQSLKLPLGFISQETFPLPTLHPILRSISTELHSGHGFKVLRGLPVTKHSREENIIIYAGVSSHIASQRGRQDNKFDGKPADVVLNHIKDLTATVDKALIGAPAYTADKQVFHTDAGDIVSLFALSGAAEGGQSKLASTWRVYNYLAEERPDLIRTLSEDWVVDDFENKERPFILKPLMVYQPASEATPERVLLNYARRYFTGYNGRSRSPNIPAITEAHAEALDALHFLGEKYHIGLDVQQGDIQYVNNLAVFHARDGFRDTPEQQYVLSPSSDNFDLFFILFSELLLTVYRRHLIRLWLRDPENAWPTPEAWKQRWDQLYDGVTAENQIFPLEPRIRTSGQGTGKEEEKEK
ncbi:hypothetical protein HYFRA_00012227 [Hymenoscyphus fraxineus]|uniref:TauD/TfdA-like domain-containing protein n=1 Tax=Hymenoscyphus fraxineus TaxID=746836 RepID=A0A9N9L1X0_9HELO|nr:hypothetical protein HYFRA_00012227 [Hymenoscyphus fraxineus]